LNILFILNINKLNNWNLDLWQRFSALRERLPHAILLQGRAGIGKLAFAEALVASLLCESPQADGLACGECLSCGWLEQGNHPDFRLITPEDRVETDESGAEKSKKRNHILVDQIRGIGDMVGLSSHRQGMRVVLLHPAEALNLESANALLKMLEEPPAGMIFVLVSHQSQRLLPTIRSRCHKISMAMPSKNEVKAWLAEQGVADPEFCLAQAGGAPLLALEANESLRRDDIESLAKQLAQAERVDPFTVASGWAKTGMVITVTLLQKWVYDILSVRFYNVVRYFPANTSALQKLGQRADLRRLLDYQRQLAQARAQATHPLNAELQLEALLLKYSQIF
jgi:DNA polymerase-3 subunit delta'